MRYIFFIGVVTLVVFAQQERASERARERGVPQRPARSPPPASVRRVHAQRDPPGSPLRLRLVHLRRPFSIVVHLVEWDPPVGALRFPSKDLRFGSLSDKNRCQPGSRRNRVLACDRKERKMDERMVEKRVQ